MQDNFEVKDEYDLPDEIDLSKMKSRPNPYVKKLKEAAVPTPNENSQYQEETLNHTPTDERDVTG